MMMSKGKTKKTRNKENEMNATMTQKSRKSQTIRGTNDILTELVALVTPKAPGLKEEYTWMHVRNLFPNAPDATLSGWVDRVLMVTGF